MNDATSLDLLQRLTDLNQIGIALSRQKDITRLLEVILAAAKEITNADGGTLYRMHQVAIYGFIKTGLVMLASRINRWLRPRLKLH